ncbi:MAG: hypothetical protein KJ600_06660 [Nanoarchaeota archaeon]|nr:hypothetical protein [Nanoarchaeota archaeon]
MAQSDESPQAPSETKKPRWHNGTAPASRVRLSLESENFVFSFVRQEDKRKKVVRIKETMIGP